jgi:hypothetical protein
MFKSHFVKKQVSAADGVISKPPKMLIHLTIIIFAFLEKKKQF